MSLEKIIADAIEGNPLNLKESFEEEMRNRIALALEAKAAAAEDDDMDDEDDDMDEAACVREMKKLYASSCSKNEMYKRCNEKYGCSKGKFEALYAQYCNN